MQYERISKERLNIILLIDISKSMQGERIKQVNNAIKDIQNYLIDLQDENANIDFFLTLITFSTDATFYNNVRCENVLTFKYNGIKAAGWSNLEAAYSCLNSVLKKEKNGGIMPDFGGVAPIILLLTDGHPTTNHYKDELAGLKNNSWFKVALRYGVAIELDDNKTLKVLHDFVGANGDVIKCIDSSILKTIIKIIVLTASKVKSTSTNISVNYQNRNSLTVNQEMKQIIAEALVDVESWEW